MGRGMSQTMKMEWAVGSFLERHSLRQSELDLFMVRNSARLVDVCRALDDGLLIVGQRAPRIRWARGLTPEQGQAALRVIRQLLEPSPPRRPAAKRFW